MAQKLKKSKLKPRSQRSIEMEEQKKAAIAEYEAQEAKRRRRADFVGLMMLSYYSAAFGALSLLFDFMGFIGVIALGLGIAGLKKADGKKGKEFYAAVVGIVLASISLIIQIVRAVLYFKG